MLNVLQRSKIEPEPELPQVSLESMALEIATLAEHNLLELCHNPNRHQLLRSFPASFAKELAGSLHCSVAHFREILSSVFENRGASAELSVIGINISNERLEKCLRLVLEPHRFSDDFCAIVEYLNYSQAMADSLDDKILSTNQNFTHQAVRTAKSAWKFAQKLKDDWL